MCHSSRKNSIVSKYEVNKWDDITSIDFSKSKFHHTPYKVWQKRVNPPSATVSYQAHKNLSSNVTVNSRLKKVEERRQLLEKVEVDVREQSKQQKEIEKQIKNFVMQEEVESKEKKLIEDKWTGIKLKSNKLSDQLNIRIKLTNSNEVYHSI